MESGGRALRSHTLLLLSAVLVLLGACRAEQSPLEVVQSFMSAIETFDAGAAENLVCEAQRARVRESLEPFGDVAQLDEAFDVSYQDLAFEERSGDEGMVVVHVSGALKLSFLGQEEVQDVDEEHVVVKEHGRWVICDP